MIIYILHVLIIIYHISEFAGTTDTVGPEVIVRDTTDESINGIIIPYTKSEIYKPGVIVSWKVRYFPYSLFKCYYIVIIY